jgi:hypothetical protein
VLGHLNSFTEELEKYLGKHREPYPFKKDLFDEDPIREELGSLIGSRLGEPMVPSELEKALEAGKDRYDKRIPPGFLDADKEDDLRFGDLILWLEMLEQAKKTSRPVLFVTDDEKEDWWWKYKGRTLGPRPELVHEMFEVSAQRMYMYNSLRFIEEAKAHFDIEVSEQTIEEVETVREMSVRDQRAKREGQQGADRARGPIPRLVPLEDVGDVGKMSRSDVRYWIDQGVVTPLVRAQDGTAREFLPYREILLMRVLHEIAIDSQIPMEAVQDHASEIMRLIPVARRQGFLVVTESSVIVAGPQDVDSIVQDMEDSFTVVPVGRILRGVSARLRR